MAVTKQEMVAYAQCLQETLDMFIADEDTLGLRHCIRVSYGPHFAHITLWLTCEPRLHVRIRLSVSPAWDQSTDVDEQPWIYLPKGDTGQDEDMVSGSKVMESEAWTREQAKIDAREIIAAAVVR